MRYTILSSFLAIAAVQAAPQSSPSTFALPWIPVLPLKGVADVQSGNGFNSIALSLTKAAQGISTQADLIATANVKLNSNIIVDPTPNILTSIDLVKAAGNASATLWQLAYDLETKVCSIATSINKQNIAAQQANLVAAIQAQVSAVVKLQQNIAATVAAVESQSVAFSEAEKSILTSAIQAFVASVLASSAPLTVLATGLKDVGIAAIADAAGGLELQTSAFSNFAGKVNFVGV